jgi:integrase/recombinase XerD
MADEKGIHPLRQRMIDDMKIRGMAALTQRSYLRSVRNCCAFAHKPPQALTFEDVRLFQLHMVKSGVSAATLNGHAVALRFFFRVTLRQSGARDLISLVPPPQRIPSVLTLDETARLLEHAPGLKWRAALSVAYGAGLRAAEVCNLKIGDLDSAQMLIRVEQGKRYKDRYAKLSPALLTLLREWWRSARPPAYLFPSRASSPFVPVTTRSLNRAFHMAKDAAGIDKPASLHTLRHSFATHLLEDRVDIRVIQALLGHKKLDTSAIYVRVTPRKIQEVEGPYEKLQFTGALPD